MHVVATSNGGAEVAAVPIPYFLMASFGFLFLTCHYSLRTERENPTLVLGLPSSGPNVFPTLSTHHIPCCSGSENSPILGLFSSLQ